LNADREAARRRILAGVSQRSDPLVASSGLRLVCAGAVRRPRRVQGRPSSRSRTKLADRGTLADARRDAGCRFSAPALAARTLAARRRPWPPGKLSPAILRPAGSSVPHVPMRRPWSTMPSADRIGERARQWSRGTLAASTGCSSTSLSRTGRGGAIPAQMASPHKTPRRSDRSQQRILASAARPGAPWRAARLTRPAHCCAMITRRRAGPSSPPSPTFRWCLPAARGRDTAGRAGGERFYLC